MTNRTTSEPREMPRLTDKQRRFVSAYLITGNGTRSAREAGYQGGAVTLASVARDNLRKPQIAEAIARRQASRNERMQLAEDYELTRIHTIAERAFSALMEDEDATPARISVAVDALMAVAKIRGKLVTKVQTNTASGVAEMLERLRTEM